MDSNNMYQNQQSGQNPDNNQNGNQGGYYQNTYTQGDNNQNTYMNANSNPNANPSYQYNPYNNGYQSTYQPMQGDLEEPVSLGEWMITLLLMVIPCVGIIMPFVWAFSSGTKKSKSNYFKAVLIFAAIYLVLFIISMAAFGGAITEFFRYYY
ncbi:MAG: hypothetical protein K2K21_08055 [Lachnospiraceae bacterium]|nr:hypothetical protein [Lachnospiraceae bacterium]